MPVLEINTNVKVDDAKALVLEFSQLAAETLGKPESYISVSYNYNEAMSWGGSFDPTVVLNIISLENINPAANEKYSKTFFDYFEKKLGVLPTRGYVSMWDPGNANIGHNKTTFVSIFGRP